MHNSKRGKVDPWMESVGLLFFINDKFCDLAWAVMHLNWYQLSI